MKLDSRLLGNVLIAVSIISTIYIYWPVVVVELTYRTGQFGVDTTKPKSSQFGIVIPSLGINEAVTANVDPFNKSVYQKVLQSTVAHARGSGFPDQSGSTYLFAHSSDNPFSITRYNTSFYLLDRLRIGDEITVYYQEKPYTYKVREIKVVKPQEVEALTNSKNKNQLTLQTCTPVGTAINRLLVMADLIVP